MSQFWLAFILTLLFVLGPVVYGVMWLRVEKPAIFCVGCSSPTEKFFSCLKGTGKGSQGCFSFQQTKGVLSKIEGLFKQLMGYITALKNDVLRPLEKAGHAVSQFFDNLKLQIPKIPDIPVPHDPIPPCKIPVVNIDVCSFLDTAIDGAVAPLVKGLNAAIDGINVAIDKINDAFADVFKFLVGAFKELFKIVTSPFQALIQLGEEMADGVFDIFKAIDGSNVLELLAYQAIRLVQLVFPFMSVYMAAAVLMLVFGAPILASVFGVLYSVYTIAANAVSMIIG